MKLLSRLLFFGMLGIVFPFIGCYQMPQMPPQIVPEVVVAIAEKEEVQCYSHTTGITESESMVHVVARVSGFLEARYFQDSAMVKEGDALFLIEQAQYKAQFDAANATVQVAEAKVALALANAERAKPLADSRAISAEEYQTRVAEYQESVANLVKAQADARLAKLNLDYTQVYAPIAGMLSTSLIKVGNMVGMSSENSHLTTIQQMDPINILFDVTDIEFNEIMDMIAAEAAQQSSTAENPESQPINPAAQPTNSDAVARSAGTRIGGTVPVVTELPEMTAVKYEPVTPLLKLDSARRPMIDIALPNPSGIADYAFTGQITAIDNTIRADTGQIRLRGKIPNPDYRIFPGQICRVRFYVTGKTSLLLIREEAILSNLSQKYILVVDADNVVHRRNITIGEQIDATRRVVRSGLEPGERYITAGLQKAKDGEKVVPISVNAAAEKK